MRIFAFVLYVLVSTAANAEQSQEVEDIFFPVIERLEEESEPFKSCRLISSPRGPADFGISAEKNGYIDEFYASWLTIQAASGGNADKVMGTEGKKRLVSYVRCMKEYGLIIRRAAEIIGKENNTTESIKRAVRERYSQKKTMTTSPCSFDGNIYALRCGRYRLRLSGRPELRIGGVPWFGTGVYAGASIKVVFGPVAVMQGEDRSILRNVTLKTSTLPPTSGEGI